MGSFAHILSIQQFLDKSLVSKIFADANLLANTAPANYPQVLKNKIIATLFFEPSTRTRLSFEAAVQRLGGQVISTENANLASSSVKGETLEDTIRVVNAYSDAIIIRHSEMGAATRASLVSRKPIINAGDGAGEHPTQALLDLYTIQHAKGCIENLKIALVGDVVHSRTIRSLVRLLSMYELEVFLVAPKELQFSVKELEGYQGKAKIQQLTHYQNILGELDVMYTNRIQQERFTDQKEFEKLKKIFCVTRKTLQGMKSNAIILNPLPRTHEIDPEIDSDPRALYFEQVKNGLFVRMALLKFLFS